MRTRFRLAAVGLGAGLLALIGAGAAVAAPSQGDAPSTAVTVSVSVDDNFFQPKKLTVTVPQKVTWEWDGLVAHNVDVEKGPQTFKSKTQTKGTFSRTIRKPGKYQIVCTLHPGMEMTIRAKSGRPSTTSTAPPAT